MITFTDRNGLGWCLELDVSTVRLVRDRLAIDLGGLVHLCRLAAPEGWEYFVAVLRAILEPQAAARGWPPGAISFDQFDRPTLTAIRAALLQFGTDLWEARLEASIDRIFKSSTEGNEQCPPQVQSEPARPTWSCLPISRN